MFEIVTKGGPWGHYLEIKCQKKPTIFFSCKYYTALNLYV